jgi:FemAB-related protein (PEP-CTERM system-associated)
MSAAAVTTLFPQSPAVPLLRPVPSVELLPKEQGAAWDAYVARHPDTTLYHLHAWRDVAERAYGIATTFIVARDAGTRAIRGVLPLFRIPRPTAPYLTSGLFGAYGRILADDEIDARALLSAATQRVDLGDASFLHLKVLGGVPEHTPLERQDEWVMVKLHLEASDEAMLRGLSSGMRNKIRHAQRAGLTFHRGRADLDAFYEVLSTNMRRKGAPIYGKRFFEVMLEAFGDRADVVTLRHEGHVVSGALVAWTHGTLYVPFSSSLPSVFPLRASNLLWWEMMRMARAMGAHTLDFGSSLRGSTGLAFKTGWRGTVVEPIGSYLYAAGGVEPVLVPKASAAARAAVRVLEWLPRPLYEAVGPGISRWIA